MIKVVVKYYDSLDSKDDFAEIACFTLADGKYSVEYYISMLEEYDKVHECSLDIDMMKVILEVLYVEFKGRVVDEMDAYRWSKRFCNEIKVEVVKL